VPKATPAEIVNKLNPGDGATSERSASSGGNRR
jgi:hypothetical protein